MRRRDLLSGLVLAAWPIARARGQTTAPDEPLVVIAQPGNAAASNLTVVQLAGVYTGGLKNWPNGEPVVAFNYAPGDPRRVVFERALLKMTPEQVARFWVDVRVRGGARPPRQVPDPLMMLRLVAKIPGAIGYVPLKQADATVRALARVEKGSVAILSEGKKRI